MSRLVLVILFATTSQSSGCRGESSNATRQTAPAESSSVTAQDATLSTAVPVTPAPAIPAPSTVTLDTADPVAVGFRFIKTMWDFFAYGRIKRDSRPPTFEPELLVSGRQTKAESFKVFPCAPKQMASPAYNICVEYSMCRELGEAEVGRLATVLPSNVRAVVACARSPKGPAHLLVLRIVDNAVVVELTRTDPDPSSTIAHPLCPTCPNVRLRPWEETRRVPLDAASKVGIEAATQTQRRVMGILY